MSRVAVLHIGCLATLAGFEGPRRGEMMRELELRQDFGVLIGGGRIVAIGPSREIAQMPHDEVIDAGGRLAVPGFVDAHTHAVFGGSRADEFARRAQGATYAEIAASGGGIHSSVRATRAEDLVAPARRHLAWCLRCGTTTIEVKSGYGLEFETEQRMLDAAYRAGDELHMRVVGTFLGAHAVPPEAPSREAYVNEVLRWARRIRGADFVDMFVEEGYFTPDDARRLATCGKPLRLHVDQMRDGGGAALAAELGAVTADHLEHTGSDGIAALAASKTMPVLLPTSVFGLRLTKYPDARAMIEAGLPVVLATDFNPGSSPSPSIPFAMSLAMLQMGMDPAECLIAATINAAYSLGVADEVGSIEPGKRADLLILDCGHPSELPYWIAAPIVREVLVAGRRVAFDGDLV